MGPEGNATTSSSPSPASPSIKRGRYPEDEVYVGNLHSHKRYLSEIMASSLNGLTVGDLPSEDLMDSPVRSESMVYFRDDISLPCSPMSEDSDYLRYYECPMNACFFQPEIASTSPESRYRCQKPVSGYSSVAPTILYPPQHVLFPAASP